MRADGKRLVGPLAWRLLAAVLFLAAVALAWLAFTQFDATRVSTDSPAGQREFEQEQMRDARSSATLGVAAAFALLGTFACWQRGERVAAAATNDAGTDPPQP